MRVSEVGFGTWQTIGAAVDDTTTRALIRTAIELGVTLFDTADVYADGAAEIALGKALREHRRADYVIATKCFFPWADDPSARGLSPAHIERAVERSLRNLQVEVIDLMQCHRFDPETPLEATCEAMAALVRSGKIRHWGVGRFSADQLDAAVRCAQIPPISDQHVYNALNREIEAAILPMCATLGLGMLAYSPLAQGVLTGKYGHGSFPPGSRAEDASARAKMWELNPAQVARVSQWDELAKANGTTVLALALCYCLRSPTVSSLLVGASSPMQLRSSIEAAQSSIDATLLFRMESS